MNVKRFFGVLLVVMVIALLVVMPVFAMQLRQTGEINDPVQLYIIGLIASVIVSALKFIAAKYPHWVIKREWLTVGLFVISLLLSWVWSGVTLPSWTPCSDGPTCVASATGFINALMAVLAVPFAFATIIYNLFLKKVLDEGARRIGLK